MTAPRLEIRLDRIHHNAKTLADRLALRGIGVTGVTNAALGLPSISRTMLDAGVNSISDARIENIEAMRRAGLTSEFTLIRSPMISQAERVVASTDISHTALRLCKRTGAHPRILLMIELGDLRRASCPPSGSSDHLVLDNGRSTPAIGSEVRFQVNCSALLRAMTSPFVAREISEGDAIPRTA